MSEMISVSEFARRAGCDEKQVRRAVEKGLLRKENTGLLGAAQLARPWRRQNRRTLQMSEKVSGVSVGHLPEVSGVSPKVSGAALELSEAGVVMSEGAQGTLDARAFNVGWLNAASELGLDVPMIAAEAVLDCGADRTLAEAVFTAMRSRVAERLLEIAAEDGIEPEVEFEDLAEYWLPGAFAQPQWEAARPWPRGAAID